MSPQPQPPVETVQTVHEPVTSPASAPPPVGRRPNGRRAPRRWGPPARGGEHTTR